MMQHYRARLLLAAFLAVPLAAASGQDRAPAPTIVAVPTPQRFEAAQAARAAMGGDRTIARIFDAMRTRLVAIMAQKGHVTSEKAATICDTILMPAMKAHLPELGNEIANIYARDFTIDELHQLAAFYDSPLGQKVIETLPGLTMEMSAAGHDWAARVARQAIQEHQQALREKGISL